DQSKLKLNTLDRRTERVSSCRMLWSSCRFLVIAFAFACGQIASAIEPANPNASPSTRALLNFFDSLNTRSHKKILSGQFSDFGKGANLRIMERVHEKTGH